MTKGEEHSRQNQQQGKQQQPLQVNSKQKRDIVTAGGGEHETLIFNRSPSPPKRSSRIRSPPVSPVLSTRPRMTNGATHIVSARALSPAPINSAIVISTTPPSIPKRESKPNLHHNQSRFFSDSNDQEKILDVPHKRNGILDYSLSPVTQTSFLPPASPASVNQSANSNVSMIEKQNGRFTPPSPPASRQIPSPRNKLLRPLHQPP